jgi:hypothetical protein
MRRNKSCRLCNFDRKRGRSQRVSEDRATRPCEGLSAFAVATVELTCLAAVRKSGNDP